MTRTLMSGLRAGLGYGMTLLGLIGVALLMALAVAALAVDALRSFVLYR